MGSLVDKSMVAAEAGGRYGVLETLRQFGEEQLAASGHTERFRAAHLAHYEDLVLQAHAGLQGPHEAWWWRRLNRDVANVRAGSPGPATAGTSTAPSPSPPTWFGRRFGTAAGSPLSGSRPPAPFPASPTTRNGRPCWPAWPAQCSRRATSPQRPRWPTGRPPPRAPTQDVRRLPRRGAGRVHPVWQGKLAEALPVCAQAIELARRDGNRVDEAMVRVRPGDDASPTWGASTRPWPPPSGRAFGRRDR